MLGQMLDIVVIPDEKVLLLSFKPRHASYIVATL